jgi:dihydrofolate reductase
MMRKIVLDLAVSLDGFIEGPNGEIDWCIMDDDMNFEEFLHSIDTLFYGRVSYELWGNFQPPSNASSAEKALWEAVHSKSKYVFSSSPPTSPKVPFMSGDIAPQVHALLQQPGKNIWLFGGAGLISTFIDLQLIDSYRISVHPIALGAGKPLFEALRYPLHLELIEVNRFRSGVVQLIYHKKKIGVETSATPQKEAISKV